MGDILREYINPLNSGIFWLNYFSLFYKLCRLQADNKYDEFSQSSKKLSKKITHNQFLFRINFIIQYIYIVQKRQLDSIQCTCFLAPNKTLPINRVNLQGKSRIRKVECQRLATAVKSFLYSLNSYRRIQKNKDNHCHSQTENQHHKNVSNPSITLKSEWRI